VATWFKKDLGVSVLAVTERAEVERLVKEEMLGGSEQVAAFTRRISGDLHCSVVLYLNPMALVLLCRPEHIPVERLFGPG
jgi:hypothetical protein